MICCPSVVFQSDGKGNQDKDTTSLMVMWATKDGNDYDGDTEGIHL